MPKIIVRVGKNGELKVTMEGVKGPQCVELTKALRDELGETVELEHTCEYSEDPETEAVSEKLRE